MSAGLSVEELASELSKWHTASQLAQLLGGSPASIVQAHRAGRAYKRLKLLRRKAKEADYKGGAVDRRVQFLWSVEGDPDAATLADIVGTSSGSAPTPAPMPSRPRTPRSARSTPKPSAPAAAATTTEDVASDVPTVSELGEKLTTWHEVSTLAAMIGSSPTSIYNSFRQSSKHRGLTFRRREIDDAERERLDLHRLTKYLWSVEPGFSDKVLTDLRTHLIQRARRAAAPAAKTETAKERRQARTSAPSTPKASEPAAATTAARPTASRAASSNGSLDRLVAAAREVVVTRREDSIEELGRALFSYLGG